ncbi:MAG: helix-turn-helix transcriptional regulator [Clostridiales bacterium]|nr:helix-turn-helix transcriptional regulator [Clostridiales bacterium]
MEDIKKIIGKNIIDLRKKHGLTQAELAEKVNYSDKAVSKWECGDAVPDISVLKQLADYLNVTVDYLLHEEHQEKKSEPPVNHIVKRNQKMITFLSVALVWLVATILFTVLDYVPGISWQWIVFVYSVPLSFIVLLVFNCIWGTTKWNFAIITGLVWSFLLSVYLTLLSLNLWMVFIIGIPAQIIIILWSGIKKID